MRGRRAARRTPRRTARRRSARVVAGPASRAAYRRSYRRRRRRRVLVVGGAVLLATGGAAYAGVKLAQKDADRIEGNTGVPPEELTDAELQGAIDEVGIQSMEAGEQDEEVRALQHNQHPITTAQPTRDRTVQG
jgi:hypothetical protein